MSKILSASALVFTLALSSPAGAQGIPVMDAANITQSTLSAMEDVAQTLKQIEQYQTQLQQYENMLQNTAAPAAYIWDEANRTLDQLNGAMAKLEQYKQQAGGLDAYLAKFGDLNSYCNSPCYSAVGCTDAERQALLADQAQRAAEVQKRTNDGLARFLDEQQRQMDTDAATLSRLQAAAQGATGQMQATQAGNQLLAAQINQMAQIRALLIAQQNAEMARAQVQADREAREEAAAEAALKPANMPALRKLIGSP